uniref:Ion transport domain-containing protein n=1 Tax=Ditylum brightwellii TaxID=49249 RepID=A0A7S4RKL8_9STRA
MTMDPALRRISPPCFSDDEDDNNNPYQETVLRLQYGQRPQIRASEQKDALHIRTRVKRTTKRLAEGESSRQARSGERESVFRSSSSSSLSSLMSSSSSSGSSMERSNSAETLTNNADLPSQPAIELVMPSSQVNASTQTTPQSSNQTPPQEEDDMSTTSSQLTKKTKTPLPNATAPKLISPPRTDPRTPTRPPPPPQQSLMNAALLSPRHLRYRTTSLLKTNKERASNFLQRSKRKPRRSSRAKTPPRSSQPKRSAWLISADHPLKILWDVLTIIVSIFGGYLNTHSRIRDRDFDQRPFVVFTEVWFLIDILLNFVTEHKTSDGHLIQDGKAVWARYLTSWFVVDVLSLIPWETMYVKPIVEVQKKRGFFKKSFFRTKAVVRVTRVLRGRHFKLFGRVAKQTKTVGVGGQRLLKLIIRYVPKYRLFFKNMRAVIALRGLRQIHWIRKVMKGLWVESKTFGGAISHYRERRRRQQALLNKSAEGQKTKTGLSSLLTSQRGDFHQFHDDDSSLAESHQSFSDASLEEHGDDDDSAVRRLYLQHTRLERVRSSDTNSLTNINTPVRHCRSDSIGSMDSYDEYLDRHSSSPFRLSPLRTKSRNERIYSLDLMPPPPLLPATGKCNDDSLSSVRSESQQQIERKEYKRLSSTCTEDSSLMVGEYNDDGDNKIQVTPRKIYDRKDWYANDVLYTSGGQ